MMNYNPWDKTPRSLDEETLKWLLGGGLDGTMGVRDGYRYQGNAQPGGWLGGDAGEYVPAAAATQFDRIAVDEQGRDIGRDFEAYDPSGNYSHSWIGGGQTFLDKIAPFIPAIAAAVTTGMPIGLPEAAASGADFGGLESLITSMGGMPAAGMSIPGGTLSLADFGSMGGLSEALGAFGSAAGGAVGGGGTAGAGGAAPAASAAAAGSIPGLVKDWLPVVGGIAAAATTDKQGEQTAKREPWDAAQPLLKDLLAQGQTLAKQDPFSPYKKSVMEQQAGLLSGINAQALPGLLQSLQGLSTPYRRGGTMGPPTLSGLPTQFDPMRIFNRGS